MIAGAFVEDNWGLSFIIPGAIIGFMGFMVFLFLVPKPQHVGCSTPDHGNGSSASSEVKHRTAECAMIACNDYRNCMYVFIFVSQASAPTRRKFHRNYTDESLGVGASISTSGEGFSGFDDSDSSSDASDQVKYATVNAINDRCKFANRVN